MKRPFALWLAALVLAGCAPDLPASAPVAVEVPEHFGAEPTEGVPSRTAQGAEADPRWWRTLHDAELTSLVERVAAQNLDLKAAAERVIQAGAQRRIVASQAVPHVEGQSLTTYNRGSPNGMLKLLEPAPGAPLDYALFQDGLQSSWELDLFGRVKREIEAAGAEQAAAVEDRNGVALAAVAEVAQNYLQLRGAQARIAITERDLVIARDNIRLVQSRFDNGVATTLDLAQARAQQATVEGTLPPLRTQEAQLINAIGLLLGELPRALEGELKPTKALPRVPARVPVGVPGSLVRRRPDVREAEARLHATTAETGVAVASFYPDVTLNGQTNLQSLHLSNLFVLASNSFNVGPSVSIPIFEGGRLRGNLSLRESQQREAAVAFQRTVLSAFREVDDALTAYAQAQRRRSDVGRAAAQNTVALRASQQRYREGLVDFLNVNSAQMQLLQSQNDVADADVQITTDLVQLYRALGGGWEIAGAVPAAAAIEPAPRFPPRGITDLVDVVPDGRASTAPVPAGPGAP
ncbi:efflux transporter outer membrane subunit [Lichenibacterium minor]|uniref:Efflux transporter outer membrane subunit n=1 Tax=Lichenibacterium minor TaxID=2316528 RepID=A0A4Q2TZP8_9HYPH|nr:efflux transporter outer membrane subunit [Lichenibacterium minor]RYC29250.1 efflux transporter outer membrane subunit [Lichenibacterium minor]